MNTWLVGTVQGLYQSVDGQRWMRINAYDYRVTSIVRTARRLCISTGSGLWHIPSESQPWVQCHDETLTEVLDLAFVPGDPGLVAASAYGVASAYKTDTGVVRWAWHSDALAVNARYTNTIVAETAGRWIVGTEAGLLVTDDAGATWRRSSLTGAPVRALCRWGERWWAGVDAHGVWTSDDALSWTRAGAGFSDVTVYDIAPAGARLVAATDAGVLIGNGADAWHHAGLHGFVSAVGAHPADPDFWVAGCVPGGVWTTRDAGVTWRNMPGLPNAETVLPPEAAS